MKDLNVFDTSSCLYEYRCNSDDNKKVVDVLKDETCGRRIKEFVGLKAKCPDNSDIKVAKDVLNVCIKRRVLYDMYHISHLPWYTCVHSTFALAVNSKRHRLYTMRNFKKPLQSL